MIHQNISKYLGYIISVDKYKLIEKDFTRSTGRTDNIADIVYYISGRDITISGDKTYINTANTVKIVPPVNKLPTNTAIKTEESGDVINLIFWTKDPFITETMVLDAEPNPKLKNLFQKLHNIWILKKNNYQFEATAVFYQIMSEIFNTLEHNKNANKKLEKAINHIHANYPDKNFRFDELAKMCNLQHAQFNKLFQQSFKTTPVKYVTNLRMQLAIDMLINQNYSIAEISEKTGYDSVSYFSRVFSKNMGTVPSKYLESHNSYNTTLLKPDNKH